MAGYFVNGGDIPLRYFDKLSYERTFKVKAFGFGLRDIFEALCEILQGEEVVDLCKVDSNTFNFTVKDEQAADILNNVGRIRIKDKVFPVISISKQVVEFRVHWLPSYIKDSFIEDFFSHYGTVTSVTRDAAVFSPNDTKRTGVRRVMLETDELRKRTLPYVVNFNGGYTALVTMAGRPPLCLRCRTIGHLRKDCNPGSRTEKTGAMTYAQATVSNQAEGQGDQDSQENSELSQGGDLTTTDNQGTDANMQGQDYAGDGAHGGDLTASLSSTGSTIPPNVPKRNLDSTDDDDDLDSHGNGLMIDDDRLEGYVTMGHGGKKVKK